jgi:hypothetical protein
MSLVAAAVAVPLFVAGCTSSATPAAQPSAPTDAIELPAQSPVPPPAQQDGLVAPDPFADVEVDDQFGNGREVAVTSVLLSRGPAVLVISDMTGQVLGTKKVTPRSQPVSVQLDRPVTVSQELLATLYLDNGNGQFNPQKDSPMIDDEGEPVSEDFDYVVQ